MSRSSTALVAFLITIVLGAALLATAPARPALTPTPVVGGSQDPGSGDGGTLKATSTGAATYNLRVVTDASPDLTDLDSFMASTTSQWPTEREKVWALFYWTHLLRRQTPPMILHGYELTDPIRNFNDYGFTQCSTISGINQVLFEKLGLRHQYWDICSHTVSSVEYDGSFHMIDSSMSNLVTRDDGTTLASVEEIAVDSARLARERSLYGTSPNGFLTGSDTARNLSPFTRPGGGIINGYSNVFCAGGLHRRDYFYNWNAGHRYMLNLRENQSYSRYYHKLGDTPEYWVGSESAGSADPNDRWDVETANGFGVRGNGSWSFTPSMGSDYARAVYRQSNIVTDHGGGIAPREAGAVAEAIYKVDAANAITSQQIHAVFSRTDAQASATIAVSVNQGQTWREVARMGAQTGDAVALDAALRNELSAQTEVLVRIQMATASSSPDALVLRSLRIDTLTEVNTKALPQLNIGRNRIHVGAGDQTETMSLWPDLRGELWRQDVYAFDNIASQPVTVPYPYQGVVYPADRSREASLTYRMEAPADLTRLAYGGRLYNRGEDAHIEFWHSFDEGRTWTMSYRLTDTSQPYDVIHYETVTDIPPGTRSVLFKYTMHSNEQDRPSLYAIRMEAQHLPAIGGARPVEVTLKWSEIRADRSRVERSHTQRVTAFPFEYDVNVGGVDHPVMESLRVNLEGSGDTTPPGYSDGVDAGGEKFQHRWRSDGTNLAAGRPYTVSVPPSGLWESAGPDDTTILTDGVVGAPETGGVTYFWGQCWQSPRPLALTVDLGATRSIGAARVHLFGYPAWDALQGEVSDRIDLMTSLDDVNYVSQGTFDTWVRRKDVPINHLLMDNERATAWNFERVLPLPVQARYVKYQIDSARIVCASELQVFDRVDYTPFDLRIALPGTVPIPTSAVMLTAPADGATLAGTTTLSATTTGGPFAGVTFYASGVAIGTVSTAPYTLDWNTASLANGAYTLTAQATTAGGEVVTSASRSVTVANVDNGIARTGWVATASSNAAAAPRAIDGSAGSRWDTGAAQQNGQWFQLDMLTPTTFDRIVLDSAGSPGDYPRGYRVSVSDDGSTWADVKSGAGTGGVTTLTFPGQTRRFVRITQTGSSSSWWSIHEARLYATGSVPPVSTPYLGSPVSLPGTIEAENFDNGGDGVAYWDSTPENEGGAYRLSEGVDIERGGDNFDVGWIQQGESLLYTVDVTAAGRYRAVLRVSSPHSAGTGQASITFGDVTSATVSVPNTGAWSNYQNVAIGGLSLAAGTQTMRLNAVRSGWNVDRIVIEPEPETPVGPAPYLGTPVTLPGTIEAENFDLGGEGVAYSDTSTVNEGGAYRPAESVDIESGGANYDVGWIETGEWLTYSVNVSAAGMYRARLRVASPLATGTGQFSLAIGGVTSAVVGVPGTGSWSTYRDVVVSGLSLAAGPQSMRVDSIQSGWNLDRIIIEPEPEAPPTPTPYLGAPVSLPGTIEAENFDVGGEGAAYADTTPENEGASYRPTEAVDIERGGANYDVGWIETGEWLAYSVNVSATGTYRARLRVASPMPAGTGQVSLTFGAFTSVAASVPYTGAWSAYQEITIGGLSLAAGPQAMRLNAIRAGFNVDSIVIEPEPVAPPLAAGQVK